MRDPKRISATVVISLFIATSVRAAPPSGGALERAVDAYVAPYRQIDVFQGVVLIGRGDKIVLQKGYGDANVELGVPNRPDRVFRIASLTKPFTEVLLGRLAERGVLSLDDKLSRWLPGFPNGDSITLDMLRTHQAGIPSMNSIPFDEESPVPNTLDSLVRAIANQPPDFPPGTKRRYSNGGYALLAAVIEKATGTSYGDALERDVLRPLGLTHTMNERDGMIVTNRAYGYRPGPTRHGLGVAPFQEMATKAGGGSLVSTAGDLHAMLRAMYRDNVVKAATWRTLFPLEDSLFSYQGRCPGYNVVMWRDFTRDIDVVVLCNNYAAGMVADVALDLTRIAAGEPRPPARWRGDVPADSAAAHAFVGRWHITTGAPLPYGSGPFGVAWRPGGLVFSIGDTPVDYMLPQADGGYLLRNLWSEVRFDSAPGGAPQPTIRPLWFKANATPLTRIE